MTSPFDPTEEVYKAYCEALALFPGEPQPPTWENLRLAQRLAWRAANIKLLILNHENEVANAPTHHE